MQRWSVLVTGDETSLVALSTLLPDPPYRCVRQQNMCVLTSPMFDAIPDAADLTDHVSGLLFGLVATIRTFSNPYAKLEFAGVRSKTPDGRNRVTSRPISILVLDPADLDPLRLPHATAGTRAMALVDLASRDPEVALAFRIMSSPTFSWREIYDIIELIGEREIIAAGWSTKAVLGPAKQTANHYRHLGEPAKNPLPPDPPSFWDAYKQVSAVLRMWIKRRQENDAVTS